MKTAICKLCGTFRLLKKVDIHTLPTQAHQDVPFPQARPQARNNRRPILGAHGAMNKEHHVCTRRRVSEAAESPLRILSTRERRMGQGASLGEEAVLVDSGREGEIAAGVGW